MSNASPTTETISQMTQGKVAESPPEGLTWYVVGGTLLAFCSGLTNAQTVLDIGLPTTHMTGNLTQVSLAFSSPTSFGALVISVVVAFVLGAAIAGAIVESTELAPRRRYGVVLVGCGVVLGSGALLLVRHHTLMGAAAIALASGTQNGLATRLSSAVVRTTHMTGIVTDLGIALGKFVSRRGVTSWRVQLYLGLLGGFVVGGVAGVYLQAHLALLGLLVPAAMLVLLGICHTLWRQWHMRQELAG